MKCMKCGGELFKVYSGYRCYKCAELLPRNHFNDAEELSLSNKNVTIIKGKR